MQNLMSKILNSFSNEKVFEITKEELEILLGVSELLAQIEILENLPLNIEQFIEHSNKELVELLKQTNFEDMRDLFPFPPI